MDYSSYTLSEARKLQDEIYESIFVFESGSAERKLLLREYNSLETHIYLLRTVKV